MRRKGAVQPRHLTQEGRLVVRQGVLDLVGHRQLGSAQHARLPQLRHPRAQQGFVVSAVAFGVQVVAMANQFGDGPLGIEDALSLDLGRVRGQHRGDVGLRQHLGDLAGADVGARQALEGHRQRAFLQMPLGLVMLAAAHMVAILGDVGQVAEIAEGANHAHRLVAGEVLQQAVEHAAGRGVLLQAVGH
jgi:hypothetical protein